MSSNTSTRSLYTAYNDDYASCERTYAELRIYSGSMDPALVTRRLGLDSTSVQKQGDRVTNSLGNTREIKKNGWFLSSENKVMSLDVRRHIDWLIKRIEPGKGRLIKLQQIAGIKMNVVCIWWSATGHGGPTLWPEQMADLSDLNLECSFDIAFFGEDE